MSLLTSALLPLVGSAGSILAWTHWRPPIKVPGQADLAHSLNGLGPLGTGLASTHGFGTTHGVIGLVSAIGCLVGVVGLILPGRLRVVAALIIALSSVAIAANGITAFLSANHLHSAWNSVVNAVGSGGSTPGLSGVSGAITRNALAPAAGASGAGVLGLMGGSQALRSSLRSLRSVGLQSGMRPRIT